MQGVLVARRRCSAHRVEDDGTGSIRRARSPDRRGLGLIGIRERAAHLKGTVMIDSARGRGTRSSSSCRRAARPNRRRTRMRQMQPQLAS